MSISYLVTTPELHVLAHFCGHAELPGFPATRALEEDDVQSILTRLEEKGMVAVHGREVAVDPVVRFLCHTLCAPSLGIRHAASGLVCAVVREMAVVCARDKRTRNGIVLLPAETPEELARELTAPLEDLNDPASAFFEVTDYGAKGAPVAVMDKTELLRAVRKQYCPHGGGSD